MRYIKLFDSNRKNYPMQPDLGDYVICDPDDTNKFFGNKVGRVIGKKMEPITHKIEFVVAYKDNMPSSVDNINFILDYDMYYFDALKQSEFKEIFDPKDFIEILPLKIIKQYDGCFSLFAHNLIYVSKNEEYLKQILNQQRFDL